MRARHWKITAPRVRNALLAGAFTEWMGAGAAVRPQHATPMVNL